MCQHGGEQKYWKHIVRETVSDVDVDVWTAGDEMPQK
jgi:hypothetical protein